MKAFPLRVHFYFSIILVTFSLISCGPSRPPHIGTFIKDGSKFIELTRKQTIGAPDPKDLIDSPSITNRQPTFIHWQQDTNLRYLALVLVDPYYEYKTNISPKDDGIYEISVTEPLQTGINCIIQADPIGFPSIWCFQIIPNEKIESTIVRKEEVTPTINPSFSQSVLTTTIPNPIQPISEKNIPGCQMDIIPLAIYEFPWGNTGMKSVNIYFAIDVKSTEYGVYLLCQDQNIGYKYYSLDYKIAKDTFLFTSEGFQYELYAGNFDFGNPFVVYPSMRYWREKIDDINDRDEPNVIIFVVAEDSTPSILKIADNSYSLSKIKRYIGKEAIDSTHFGTSTANKDFMLDKIPTDIFSGANEKNPRDSFPYIFTSGDLEVTIKEGYFENDKYFVKVQYKNLNAGYPISPRFFKYSILGNDGILVNNSDYINHSQCSGGPDTFYLGPKQICNELIPFEINQKVNDLKLIIGWMADESAPSYDSVKVIYIPNISKSPSESNISKSSNITRVMDYCSLRDKSPVSISRNEEVVIYDGWLAKEKSLVQDHINAVKLDIKLDGQTVILDTQSDMIDDYDNNGNIEGYDLYFEKNVGKLTPGTHRVDAVVTWKNKIFDGWAYYGPGSANPSIEGYCEIIVE